MEENNSNRRISAFVIYNKHILTCWYTRDKWCFCESLQLIVPDAEEIDVADWLQADENDLGYTHLDDQEIIEFVVNCEQGENLHNNDVMTMMVS